MIFLFEKNIRFLTRRRIKYIRLRRNGQTYVFNLKNNFTWKKRREYQNILFGSFSINTPDTLSLFPRFTILYNTDIYIHTSSVNFERIHTGMDIFWQSVNFENVNCVTGSDLPRGGEGREKISDMPVSRHAKRWTRRARCFRNGAQCASIKKNSHPPPSQKYG